MLRLAVWALSIGAIVSSCGAEESDASPAGALARFLEAMDRSTLHEGALKDAYALLDAQAQRELGARAQRATSLTGRSFEAWEMIASGRFRLRFTPSEHGEMRTTLKGESALVEVRSEDGRSRASVPLVREFGHWRVRLALPELASVSAREVRD